MNFNLSELGLLQVSGADAKKLLQGQLTCDVERSTPCMGAHCNPQGRILYLFYLYEIQHTYYLLLPRSMLAIAMAALKKYALFYKVALTNVSSDFMIMGSTTHDNTHAVSITIPTKTPRYIYIDALSARMDNTTKATFNAWKILDIYAQIPMIYPQTSEKFLPHELHLDKLGAISFDKGCYTGQEIIARMHYKGKLKSHLYTANIISQHPPLPGDIIYALKDKAPLACGVVVDIAHEKNNDYCTLIVTDEANAKNQHLFLSTAPDQHFSLHPKVYT